MRAYTLAEHRERETLPFVVGRYLVDRLAPDRWYVFCGWAEDPAVKGQVHYEGERYGYWHDHYDDPRWIADELREMDWREAILLGLA